ncbi:MAG: SurA N-terminal domain-containing protein [bacterium]|nr:SurA N-terminal domain-containing protein [bacterium]
MLDLMRKQAASWGIKAALALIILTFIFFFGYTQLTANISKLGGQEVALVNGEPISSVKFEKILDNQLEQFRKNSKGSPLSEEIQGFLKNSILNSLIRQKLVSQLARNLSVKVTEEELAKAISQTPSLQKEGQFDELLYRNNFRPYYQREYGSDYEKDVEEDLLQEKLMTFLQESIFITDEEVDLKLMEEKENDKKKKPKKTSLKNSAPEKDEIRKRLKEERTQEILDRLLADFAKKAKIQRSL